MEMDVLASVQASLAVMTFGALAQLESEIKRRGLQEAYILELCPWYHHFEAASIDELWALLQETPGRRIEIAIKVLTNAPHPA